MKNTLKAILFLFIILILVFITIDNIGEKPYEPILPPGMELTDGTGNVEGSLSNIKNWHYRGRNGDFLPLHNINSVISQNISSENMSPPKVLFYNGNLTLNCSHIPNRISVEIFKDNNLILREDNILPADEYSYKVSQPKEEGELLYRITAIWDEPVSEASKESEDLRTSNITGNLKESETFKEKDFYGEATYEFAFINNVPVEFEISSTETYPGELLTIYARYADEGEEIVLKSDLIKADVPFFKYKEGKFAIIPLSYDLQPSDYNISLTVKDNSREDQDREKGNQGKGTKTYNITVKVLPKDFPIQHLTISEEVDQATRNDEAYEEYDKYVGAVRKTVTPEKMWDGAFLKPVEGRITTEFGMRRFVNNAPTSYRHSGIDIAAATGTPVKAANSGRVILARYLTLTGNTVLIDHGYGIISWSYHMDSIDVSEGEYVTKGQIIGKVGSTGFSTGPHLHFAVSVNDIFTNPWTLFKQEPVLFK